MKKIFFTSTILFSILAFNISCIDRDTIAGTGKEIPDKIINIGGTLQFGRITTKLADPLRVRVIASNGRPVKGIIVVFYVENSNASLSDSNITTDADGYAQTFVTLGTKADSVRVYASVLGLKGSPIKFSLLATVSTTTPKPTELKLKIWLGNYQTAFVGQKLDTPLVVKLVDLYDNPIPNTMIYFSTSNGTVKPDSALTNIEGFASAFWTLDTIIGTQNAKAVCPGIVNGTINFTAQAMIILVPKYFTRLSPDTSISLRGLTINKVLRVNVLDQFKNPIYNSPPNGFHVDFTVTEGFGSVTSTITDENGDAFAGVTLASNDSILKITADVKYGLPVINFTFFAYKGLQIDSLKSSGGIVTIFWQKNLNLHFANYTLQRCNNSNFDETTIDLKIITNEDIVSTQDTTAVVGSSPFYRIKVNYTNGFNFYTNLRDVSVNP